MNSCRVIPTPKSVCCKNSFSHYGTGICAGEFRDAADAFAAYAEKALGLTFTEGSDIILKKDPGFAPGEYKLICGGDAVTVIAGGSRGISYGLATLLQMAQARDGKLYLSDAEIYDRPECDYRGLLIDCARNRHSVELLKKYIDLCWFYKLGQLHLHLTDDQSYTLPSKLYPKLTTQHNCYTEAEIAELCEYARVRDVQLVPEIDSPGHSEAMRRNYPELLGGKGIVCFHEETIRAMQNIYRELCDMFPYSEYIHMGGDESRLGWWLDCEKCIEYGRNLGIKAEDEAPGMSGNEYVMLRYLAYFINKMGEAITEKGRKPLVWEGFHKAVNGMVSRDITVMVFESYYQLAGSLIADGFNVINCSWKPTYIVTPCWHWDKRECYNWDVYSFSAVSPDSPYCNGTMRLDPTAKITGGQLSSWGDTLGTAFGSLEEGLRDELEKIKERAPAVAENTWNREKLSCYGDFSEAHEACRAKLESILK